MSTDFYTEVTARIVAAIEAGSPPWVRPWSAVGTTLPINAATHRHYRGINVMLLAMEAATHGYQDSHWLTFRQAAALGGHVRKGEHGTTVVFWKLREVGEATESMDAMADTASRRTVPLLRTFTVFNVAQVDGLPPALIEPPSSTPAWDGHEAAELLIDTVGADIRFGGFEAFYTPGGDYIRVPQRSTFAHASGYYATTLHELVHWTGHSSRLDRQLGRRFAEEAYAAEELIAELGSAFLCAHCRIDGQLQHASYLSSWLRVLRNDKRAIFVASTKAQNAADFLLARCTESPEAEALAA